MSKYADDLALALELAELADSITLDRFEASDLEVSSKPDMTPVSDADLATEEALREKIATARPADSILGEEFGGDVEFSGRQWIIDPIDGTKNYVRGVPVWATLIALLDNGKPVAGVISAPALARRWWASEGAGAWRTFNGSSPRKLSVSQVSKLDDASLSFSSLSGWAERDLRDQFVIAAEPEVSLWDLAPLSILVTEAGGKFTSLAGVDGPHGGDAVATNGILHDETLDRLK